MQSNKIISQILWLTAIAMIFFIAGCNTDNASFAPNQNSAEATVSATIVPLTEQQLSAGPAPGYRFLHSAWGVSEERNTSLDSQHPWFAHEFVRRIHGGQVETHDIGCDIPRNALPADTEVTVSVPNPGWAVVDFGPHPLQFLDTVEIYIDVTNVTLPPGLNWRDISVWYVNDSGGWDLIDCYYDFWHHRFVGLTNHFSRYILAGEEDD